MHPCNSSRVCGPDNVEIATTTTTTTIITLIKMTDNDGNVRATTTTTLTTTSNNLRRSLVAAIAGIVLAVGMVVVVHQPNNNNAAAAATTTTTSSHFGGEYSMVTPPKQLLQQQPKQRRALSSTSFASVKTMGTTTTTSNQASSSSFRRQCDREMVASLPRYDPRPTRLPLDDDDHHNNNIINNTVATTEKTTTMKHNDSFCSRFLPRDMSAPWLWKHSLDRLLEITATTRRNHNNEQQQAQDEQQDEDDEMDELIQLVQRLASDAYRFTLSLSGRVQPEQWERVVEKVHQRVVFLWQQQQQEQQQQQQQQTTTTTNHTATKNDRPHSHSRHHHHHHRDRRLQPPQEQEPQPSTVPPPVHVWVITNPLVHNATTTTTSSNAALPVTWAHQLQGVLQRLLLGVDDQGTATAPPAIVVRVFDVPFVSTEIYTQAIKYHAFDLSAGHKSSDGDDAAAAAASSLLAPPDVIIHSMRDDMFSTPLAHDDDDDNNETTTTSADHSSISSVEFQARRMYQLQDFVRTVMESQPCWTQPPHIPVYPVVILLDDLLPPADGQASILTWNIHDRITQQVADYYRIGYLSLPRTLQTTGSAKSDEVVPNNDASLLTSAGQTALLWMVLFGLLEYSVDYCANQFHLYDGTPQSVLVAEHVWSWIHYIPPYLDAGLSLAHVTDKWGEGVKAQQERWTQVCQAAPAPANGMEPYKQVKARRCALAAWGGAQHGGQSLSVAAHLKAYLQPYLVNEKSIRVGGGWEILDHGVLRATAPASDGSSSTLSLRVPHTPGARSMIDQAKIFVVVQPFAGSQAVVPVLEWAVTVGGSDPIKRSVEAAQRTAPPASLPIQKSLAVSDSISLSAAAVDGPSKEMSTIQVDLTLVKGQTVDVVGIFLCNSNEE